MKADNVEMPARSTTKSAGYDFYAPRDIELIPGRWERVDTKVCFDGSEKIYTPSAGRSGKTYYNRWVLLMLPRSGMASKYGLEVKTTVGVIDQDYPDNVILEVRGDVPHVIKKGERFAQGLFVPVGILEGEETPRKERKGGFGSTGN